MQFIRNQRVGVGFGELLENLTLFRIDICDFRLPYFTPDHHSIAWFGRLPLCIRLQSTFLLLSRAGLVIDPNCRAGPSKTLLKFIPNIHNVWPEVTNLTLFQMKTARKPYPLLCHTYLLYIVHIKQYPRLQVKNDIFVARSVLP